MPPDGTPENKAFLASMFALLARYEAMAGAGYQAALGETAFDVLKLKLGVGCEGAAFPNPNPGTLFYLSAGDCCPYITILVLRRDGYYP